MNIQQLETFLWVARLSSFTKAAEKLNATQSTVSMRITELEKELGVHLLDRSQRQVRMTTKGRDLLRYATELQRLVTEIRTNIGDAERVSGSIRLGVAELIARTWLPQLVAGFNCAYPNVEIDLEVGLRGNSYEKIRSGEIELCFLPTEGTPEMGFEYTPLSDIVFRYMASPKLGLHGRTLTPKDIERCSVIMLGPNSVVAEIQNRWFRENEMRPTKLNRSNSMEISAGLVRSGMGISFLPHDFYAHDIDAGRMVVLDVTPDLPPVRFSAIYSSGNKLPYVQQIIDIAKRVSK